MSKPNDKKDLNALLKANEENRKELDKLSERVDDLESEIADLKFSQEKSSRFQVN